MAYRTLAQRLGLSRQQFEVAAVVSFYMVAALVMVFVNKAVLISTPGLPLFFLFIQLVIAVLLLHLSALLWPNKVTLPNVLEWNTIVKVCALMHVAQCSSDAHSSPRSCL